MQFTFLRSKFELNNTYFCYNRSDFRQTKNNLYNGLIKSDFFKTYFKNACSKSEFYVFRMQPGNLRKRLSAQMWFLH